MKITDKMRLDWMQRNATGLQWKDASSSLPAHVDISAKYGKWTVGRTIREAIDAAIRAEQPKRKPKLTHAEMLRLAKINCRKLTGKDTI